MDDQDEPTDLIDRLKSELTTLGEHLAGSPGLDQRFAATLATKKRRRVRQRLILGAAAMVMLVLAVAIVVQRANPPTSLVTNQPHNPARQVPVSVPSVIGTSVGDATLSLERAGLRLLVDEGDSDDINATVLAQEPGATASVPAQSVVGVRTAAPAPSDGAQCPQAREMLARGPARFPADGQTDLEVVRRFVDANRTRLLGTYSRAQRAYVAHRDGKVVTRRNNNVITVLDRADYQAVIELTDASACPPAPMFEGGVPLLFTISAPRHTDSSSPTNPPPFARAAGTWTTVAATPQRMLPGLVSTGSHVIIAELGRAEMVDVRTAATTVLPDPPESLFYSNGFWTGDEAMFFGFDEATKKPAGIAFKPSTQTWRSVPPPPVATDSAVALPGLLVAFSASEKDDAIHAWTFDIAGNTWKERAAAPIPYRHFFTTATAGDKVILYGGCLNDKVTNCDDDRSAAAGRADGALYDPATDTWQRIPDAPLPPSIHPRATTTAGRVVVFAGKTDTASAAAELDLATLTWQRLPEPPISSRRYATTATVNGHALFFGGENERPLGDGAYWNQDTRKWILLPSAPAPRERHHMVEASGSLVVAGNGTGAAPALLLRLEP